MPNLGSGCLVMTSGQSPTHPSDCRPANKGKGQGNTSEEMSDWGTLSDKAITRERRGIQDYG